MVKRIPADDSVLVQKPEIAWFGDGFLIEIRFGSRLLFWWRFCLFQNQIDLSYFEAGGSEV